MSKTILWTALFAALLGCSRAVAGAKVGDPAPGFTVTDSKGQTHQLSDFAGKTVVLEWTNADCPFVQKHYGAENMQRQQTEATGDGVVWLTVNSSAQGKEGYVEASQANKIQADWKTANDAYLLDTKGDVGRAYGAKTTPHMFVIDGKGTLQYAGAIDSIASTDRDDIPKATQYVEVALEEISAGKPVSTAETKAYGCSVKY